MVNGTSFVGQSEDKKSRVKLKQRCEDNIKIALEEMYFEEVIRF
jgi:hypothetical protein